MDAEYQARFGGIERLYGKAQARRLREARVAVIGIGGVGSWSVEALARSGIGHLTLIDLDDVCITNVNRQIPALSGMFGRPKVEVMAERFMAINPSGQVTPVRSFFTAQTADTLLGAEFDVVLDAIDQIDLKCLLIAQCRARGLPIISTGGAGGRRDPARVRTGDLGQATHDRLLVKVRKILRAEHGFTREPGGSFNVDCVYSVEPQVYPQSDGSVCETREPGNALRLDCRSGYGTASFVTGTFGFVAASLVVKQLVERDRYGDGALPV